MQRTIDFEAKARRTDPATSHKAAQAVNVNRSHSAVLAILSVAVSPLTSSQVADALIGRCSSSRVRGALAELVELRLVAVVDELGRTDLGNACNRYAAAKDGEQ